MNVTRWVPHFLVATLAVARAAPAQGPAERARLQRFRDSLTAITDSTALAAGEQRLISVAKVQRDSALLHLELGFLAHRLGEVTGVPRRYDDAGSEFEWASQLRPEWPYPWYGLGLAELALGEHRVIALENIRQVLRQDHLSKAARAFANATRADPAFAEAVVDLAHTALRQRVGARLDVARDALREAAATPAGDGPALQLARGRVEREVGEGDSAIAAFQRYLAVGGDSGVALLEIARSRFYVRRTRQAIATYYTAAAAGSSEDARTLFRGDIAWIATPEELRDFDRSGGRDWLERFWAQRDAEDGRRPGERIAEHYRRYFYALRHYRLVSRHRHYDLTERFRSTQDELDDRGVIYLRHGEPDRRATYSDPAIEPNESWLYVRPAPEANLILHFVAREDVADYKLVESLADAYGLRTAVAMGTVGGPSNFGAVLFESRAGLDPSYQRLGSAVGSSNRASALAAERARGRDAIHVGTITDSYVLHFSRPLAAVVRELVVGVSAPARPTVLIPFAVSGAALAAQRRGDAAIYPLAIRITARRGDGRLWVRDTVRAFSASRPMGPRDQLNGLEALELPPGIYQVRVVLAQPDFDVGSVMVVDRVVVPELGPGRMEVSDVLVGRRDDGLYWAAGRDTIPVSATVTYPAGSSVEVYYEIHGLAAGSRFRSRLDIVREGGRGFLGRFSGRPAPVSLAFDGAAEGTPTRVRQTVNLGTLDPGRYRLLVTVEDGAGDAHHARQVILTVTYQNLP